MTKQIEIENFLVDHGRGQNHGKSFVVRDNTNVVFYGVRTLGPERDLFYITDAGLLQVNDDDVLFYKN
jgi:hypothetical protein